MSTTWYRRMGDIPGLDYEPPVEIDRTSLAGHDAVPEVHRHDPLPGVHEEPWETLWWSYSGQETSASPAHGVAFSEDDGTVRRASSSQILDRLWKGLELPGIASDYHHLISGALGSLSGWHRRRREPELVTWIEWLALLDLRLVEAQPESVWFEQRPGQDGQWAQVPALWTLCSIYEAEGFLDEALSIAKRGARFDQLTDVMADYEARRSALQAEDAH